MPAIVNRYHALAPVCLVCTSKAGRADDGTPLSIPVEYALIVRDMIGLHPRYLAVCHCHGKVEIMFLGLDTPSDSYIKSRKAFA